MEKSQKASNGKSNIQEDKTWYVNNYILLKDYYDRTISRIAARCIRMGNIPIENYPFYGYVLDVLEEISETGNYIIKNNELYPYVEKKIKGGMAAFKKDLKEYRDELIRNSSPDMIKEDKSEVEKMKKALGNIEEEKGFDPTKGAGMGMDELMDKLMAQQSDEKTNVKKKIVKIKKATSKNGKQAVPSKNS